MLRKLLVQRCRPIGLTAIFLVAIIIVAIDVARAINVLGHRKPSLELLWSIFEPLVAVIISALPSYKALFGGGRRMQRISYDGKHSDTTVEGLRSEQLSSQGLKVERRI